MLMQDALRDIQRAQNPGYIVHFTVLDQVRPYPGKIKSDGFPDNSEAEGISSVEKAFELARDFAASRPDANNVQVLERYTRKPVDPPEGFDAVYNRTSPKPAHAGGYGSSTVNR